MDISKEILIRSSKEKQKMRIKVSGKGGAKEHISKRLQLPCQ